MHEIRANLLLRIPPASLFAGSYRVVLVNRPADSLWLIALSKVTGKSLAYYRRPRRYSLREMEVLLGQSGAEIGEGDVPAEWLLSDDQIQLRYERENGSSKRCSQLSIRDRRWSILAPILNQYTTFALLEGGLYYRVLDQRARELGVRVKVVASLLHLYWAGACIMNALLPKYYNSGAKGQIRIQRKKLGAPDIAAHNGVAHAADFIITQEDREKLSFGWETFLRPGKTVPSAYLRTMEAFYRASVSVVDGREIPILKEVHERPTIRQFRYWGKGRSDMRSASLLQLREGEFEKRHRALPGTARDGVHSVGQLAYCDATPNDVHLVSAVSRIRPVGTAHRILIVDAYTGLWAGLYCGFEPPSACTALLAVANAAQEKVDFCARFDIEITPHMWPAIAFTRYLADNGEFRAQASILPIAAFGSTLEFAPVGRADMKGPVESSHHVAQARLDHKIDGTTRGKRRDRGEDHPALNAVVTYFEYMRHLIRRILHHNNVERCEHLLTTEMRRDGVCPTRTSIYQWCVENGYVAGVPPSSDVVRAHLLPAMPAILTGSGVYLLRPDRGRRAEYVRGARFVGDVLLRDGLMREARRRHREIQVRGDPQDLSRVWLVRNGVHELKNVVCHDPLAIKEWTLADHLAVQDDDALARQQARGEDEQLESMLDTLLFADVDAAKREKQLEVERQHRRPSKRELTSNIRQNRELEKTLMESASLGASGVVPQSIDPQHETVPTTGSGPVEPAAASTECSSAAVDLLRQFHSRRSRT